MSKNVKVISLGGSVMCPDSVDVDYIKSFKDFILEFVKQGYKFVIVTGGGRVARDYQRAGDAITPLSDFDKDLIGIAATKLNAELLRAVFGKEHMDQTVVMRLEDLKKNSQYPITISSGWEPGCSTDYDAVYTAKIVGADSVINASKPAYVYDKDNAKYPDAKPIPRMTWQEYRAMFPGEWTPGFHAPVDPIAAKLAEESGIKMYVINGRDLDNFKKTIEGGEFTGTRIG